MNIQSARNVVEFVHVLATDEQDRPTLLQVPGHGTRRYTVHLRRNGGLTATCNQRGRIDGCRGNTKSVCYHVLASCIVSAEQQGKELAWCESKQDAERRARINGRVFQVKSVQSGAIAYGVVTSGEDEVEVYEPDLAPAGLSEDSLVALAIELTSDKTQWFSDETVAIAQDAFLANDSGFVRLYRKVKVNSRFHDVQRLGLVFYLDQYTGEWNVSRQVTTGQAMDDLFGPEQALPAQHSRGRSKLFKT